MANHSTDTYRDDEIDLTKVVLRLINVFQRGLRLLITFIIVGGIAGILYYLIAKPVYKTSLLASSKVLTNVRVVNLIQVLDNLAEESNTTQLSRKLHISTSLAETIKNVEAKGIIASQDRLPADKPTELDNDVFEITLLTSDNHQIDSLQTGILYYLQKNSYVEKRTAIQKQNLEIMRERVIEEVKKLDSLRFSVNKLLSKGIGGNSTMLLSDPSSVNKDILALYEKELQIKSDLQLIDDIQVIQDFTQFAKPSNPKLLKSVTASIGSAVTLALIAIAILEARRGMRKLKQDYEQKVIKEQQFV